MGHELGPKPISSVYAKIFGLLALLAYMLANVWCFYSQNGEMLARSGALGVAAAIVAFAANRPEVEWFQSRLRLYDKAVITGELDDLPVAERSRIDAEFEAERRALEKNRRSELILLVASTLQWGFGDLVFNTMKCGERVC